MKPLLVLVFILAFPSLSQATLTNGGFETGDFTGWSTIGDAM